MLLLQPDSVSPGWEKNSKARWWIYLSLQEGRRINFPINWKAIVHFLIALLNLVQSVWIMERARDELYSTFK